jgi:predicted outer membrane lipoprotein
MVAPHLLARPHLLAMPLLVIWAGGLIRACEEGRRPRIWLLGVMALWANLHGGFTLGIVLAAAFGVEALLLATDRDARMLALRRWGSFLALAILAAMLTPHGVEGILFTFKVLGLSYALGNIGEGNPPTN